MNQPICKCKNLRVGFLYWVNYQRVMFNLVFCFQIICSDLSGSVAYLLLHSQT